jgi:hypothetical protein
MKLFHGLRNLAHKSHEGICHPAKVGYTVPLMAFILGACMGKLNLIIYQSFFNIEFAFYAVH